MIKIKTNFLIGAAVFATISCGNTVFAQSTTNTKSTTSVTAMNLPFQMPEVQIPSFKKDTLNIVDFGAVPNTGKLCTQPINDAIQKSSESGGGVVVIPS